MRTSILTEHMLIICLMMSEGDVEISIAEIIRRVETWQKTKCRIFGTNDADFAGAFVTLVFFESDLYGIPTDNLPEKMDTIPLWQVIEQILKYEDVYFSDEGQMWCCLGETPAEGNLTMRDFFRNPRQHRAEEVMHFLREQNISQDMLKTWSEEWLPELFGTSMIGRLTHAV